MAECVSSHLFDMQHLLFCHRVVLGDHSSQSRDTALAAIVWARDDARPGRFMITTLHRAATESNHWVFVFDDADTALEFKMAWG